MSGRAISIGIFVLAIVVFAALNYLSILPAAAPPPPPPSANPPNAVPDIVQPLTIWGPRMLAQLIVSTLLLLASLFVIMTKRYEPQDKHWAYGTVGTIVGFWLNPK
jgi:hypothetical protein